MCGKLNTNLNSLNTLKRQSFKGMAYTQNSINLISGLPYNLTIKPYDNNMTMYDCCKVFSFSSLDLHPTGFVLLKFPYYLKRAQNSSHHVLICEF